MTNDTLEENNTTWTYFVEENNETLSVDESYYNISYDEMELDTNDTLNEQIRFNKLTNEFQKRPKQRGK